MGKICLLCNKYCCLGHKHYIKAIFQNNECFDETRTYFSLLQAGKSISLIIIYKGFNVRLKVEENIFFMFFFNISFD